MRRILPVHPPFCTPATPPYSISSIYSILKYMDNLDVDVLDLNLEWHLLMYPEFGLYCRNMGFDAYEKKTQEFLKKTKEDYSVSNKRVVNGGKPILFDEMLEKIRLKKAEIVAFSVVYASQVFYTYSLIIELKKLGIKTIVGGPGVNGLLRKSADLCCDSSEKLLEYFGFHNEKKFCHPDFHIWDKKRYFSPQIVIPIKTTSTCYYKGCSYCSHYCHEKYTEYPLFDIEKSVKGFKFVFLIDDMVKRERLFEIGRVFRRQGIKWCCQLRPTSEFDYSTLLELFNSGLVMIMWGVESGCDRLLKLINKGTNILDISQVISDSHKVGIKNIVYIMFGFPTETKEEAEITLRFLQDNTENIDLVSTSVFGLQKDTPIYRNPLKYGVEVKETKRTILDERIDYTVSSGMSNTDAKKFRARHKRTLEKLNKYAKAMNFFREHMLIMIGERLKKCC